MSKQASSSAGSTALPACNALARVAKPMTSCAPGNRMQALGSGCLVQRHGRHRRLHKAHAHWPLQKPRPQSSPYEQLLPVPF